jgi:two-component system alkaline phosphatase synthesis response regulator PhoP
LYRPYPIQKKSQYAGKEMTNTAKAVQQKAVLVVARDASRRSEITQTLREDGYVVLALTDAGSALEAVRDNAFSLIILDMGVQEEVATCRQLRVLPETRLASLLLIVSHVDEITQMISQHVQADDYLVKPIVREKLRACVHALLRKHSWREKARPSKELREMVVESADASPLIVGDLSIDIAKRKVLRQNREIELGSAILFDLLVYLVRHRGIVLTPKHLLQHVWGYNSDVMKNSSVRTVYVHMHWLRSLLADDPVHPQLIQTVRGVGYRFKD